MKFIKFISTLVFRIINFNLIVRKKLFLESSSMMLPVKIDNRGENSIEVTDGYVSKSSIVLRGNSNEVSINGELFKTELKIFGNGNKISIGKNVKLYNSKLFIKTDNSSIVIGNATTVGEAYIVCMGKGNRVEIGPGCMLAEGIEIWNTDGHDIMDAETGELLNPSEPIVIGENVWVGKNVSILKGVKVGSGAVIGMNSTITKDVPESSIVVGDNKVVRRCVKWSHRWTKI